MIAEYTSLDVLSPYAPMGVIHNSIIGSLFFVILITLINGSRKN
jgi:hypothetical protein